MLDQHNSSQFQQADLQTKYYIIWPRSINFLLFHKAALEQLLYDKGQVIDSFQVDLMIQDLHLAR